MNPKIGSKIGEGGCSEVFKWEYNYKIIKLAKSNILIQLYNISFKLVHFMNRLACMNIYQLFITFFRPYCFLVDF